MVEWGTDTMMTWKYTWSMHMCLWVQLAEIMPNGDFKLQSRQFYAGWSATLIKAYIHAVQHKVHRVDHILCHQEQNVVFPRRYTKSGTNVQNNLSDGVYRFFCGNDDSKVPGANMGPIWRRQDPAGLSGKSFSWMANKLFSKVYFVLKELILPSANL